RRPDVNERYNLGGWPTTAALTPDGRVLNGGTYFGRDAMIVLLTQAADSWRDRAHEIRASADRRGPGGRGGADRGARLEPDAAAGPWLRSCLVDEFDVHNG